MYCTPHDLVTRFGADELIQLAGRRDVVVPPAALEALVSGAGTGAWSSETIDAAAEIMHAIDEAIEDARAEVDPYLEARYKLPLSSVPRVIKRITIELARYILHGDMAPEPVQRRYKDMIKLLISIARGETQLGLDAADTATPTQGGIQTIGGDGAFSKEALGGYTG